MRRTFERVAVFALIAVLFVAINLSAGIFFRQSRLDLTENRLFTLSEGTKEVLGELEEPITLRFFYSSEIAQGFPRIRTYAGRVRDMLEEMASAADGKLKLRIVDPEPFSEAEDLAMSLGLKGAPTSDGEVLYFGLVGTNLVDGIETIPFFSDERAQYLEYDIVRMVQSLNRPEKPALGIVTNLPLDTGAGGLVAAMRGQSEPYAIYTELVSNFDLRFLEQDFDEVPSDVDVLMIAHPKPLDAETLYAIDQFVMRGGRVLGFLDPHSEVSHTQGQTGQPVQGYTVSSSLEPLISAWGVDYDPDEVVADRTLAQRVQAGFDARRQLVDYPLWLAVTPDYMNPNDVTTAEIDRLNLGTSGYFTAREGATTEFTPLIWSSDDAELLTADEVREGPRPDELMRSFKPTGKSYTIGVRLSGPLESAFPDGAPRTPEAAAASEGDEEAVALREPADAEETGHLARSETDANIILVADTELFDDRFWVVTQSYLGEKVAQPIADNGAFIISAVDNLMGSDALISLRARERSERRFTLVDAMQREAEARYLAEEERLQARIETAQERLAALQTEQRSADTANDAALQSEIDSFRNDLQDSRRALRAVQANLRGEIETLGGWVRFLNVAAMPLLVAVAAVGVAAVRRRRRTRKG